MNVLHYFIQKIYFKIPNNLALYDKLTGLYNRNWWEYIGKKKYDTEEVFVVMMDVNNLKLTNDTYGHSEGDKLLCSISNLLSNTFNSEDVCHYGGDEFILITFNNPESILKVISQDFCYGIIHKNPTDTLDCCLDLADKMMYKMKKKFKKGRMKYE